MKKLILSFLISIILLTGCRVAGAEPTETEKSYVSKAVVAGTELTGKLLSSKGKPVGGAAIFLAEVYRQDGKAAFVLDSGNSPSAKTDKKGNFVISDLVAGEYILVIGNPMSKYQIYGQEGSEPEVFVVEAGAKLDIGKIKTVLVK